MGNLSRFQIIDTSKNQVLMGPGKCAVCGSHTGVFVDFGMDLDFYGVVYFCSGCFRECGKQFGYIEKSRFDALVENFLKIQEAYEKVFNENKELRSAVGIADRIRSDTSDPLGALLADLEESESESTEPEGSEPVTSDPESGFTEPNNEQRPSSVRNNDNASIFTGIDI